MNFTRYAVYYVPPAKESWADFCASWLGWDIFSGQNLPSPVMPDELPLPVSEITQTPRKYGLHATLKPPFRLATGHMQAELVTAARELAHSLDPAETDRLHIARLGRFLALRPTGNERSITDIAAACVTKLDQFRAPPTRTELEKRRQARLSPGQEANLNRWGYPYVMDEFRFHITLTGKIPGQTLNKVQEFLQNRLEPQLPAPFLVQDIAIVGEAEDGLFHLIEKIPLGRKI